MASGQGVRPGVHPPGPEPYAHPDAAHPPSERTGDRHRPTYGHRRAGPKPRAAEVMIEHRRAGPAVTGLVSDMPDAEAGSA